MTKNINDITLFRYLFNLDNRNLPESILKVFEKYNNNVTKERKEVVEMLKTLKGKCRNLVSLSKTFEETMAKTCISFTKFHKKLLNELNREVGIVESYFFSKETYFVYSIDRGCLNIWVFVENKVKTLPLSIPIHYICMSPNNTEEHKKYSYGTYSVPLVDNNSVDKTRCIHIILDYLCLRLWAPVQLFTVTTTIHKRSSKQSKKKSNLIQGLTYYIFDCKWYTEISNNILSQVKGHIRLQHYKNGSSKLIWISDYTRKGYHRKAAIDKVKSGQIVLK